MPLGIRQAADGLCYLMAGQWFEHNRGLKMS